MKKLLLLLSLFFLISEISYAQAVKIPLTVTDNSGGTATLYFGLDPTATDAIDGALGEAALPPLPPSGVFDARFNLPGSTDASLDDYRQGTSAPFSGTRTHEIQFQAGNGTSITIGWVLPTGVTGTLKDKFGGVVVNVAMSGTGNTTITNLAANKLDMVITYNLIPVPTKYLITSSNLNPVAGGGVTITAQLATSNGTSVATSGKVITWSSTNGGTFDKATSTTDATGKATVVFTVSQTAGITHKVTGTDAEGLTGISGDIVTKAASAAKYILTTNRTSVVAGDTTNITAQLADQYGNSVNTSGKTVTWSSTNGGSFGSSTSITDANGRAVVVFRVDTLSGKVHTIKGKDNDNLEGTSGNVTVTTGSANKYIVTASRYSPVAGDTVKVTAQLTDKYSNIVKTAGNTINWTSTNGGTLTPTSSTTDSNGKATTVFTTSSVIGTTHVVKATDNNLLTGQTSNITTSAGPASQYLLTVSRNNPDAGDTVTIRAQLADAGGNAKAEAGKVVTWSSTNGGTFSSANSTTNSSGIASVIFTVSQVTGTTHTVSGIDAGGLKGTSGNIITKTGSASKYVITSSKTIVTAGDTTKIYGQLTDKYGNKVATGGKTVTWSSTGSGGSFSSATSTTDSNGEVGVVFTVNTVSGTIHTVKGKDADNLEGTSGNITVKSAAGSKYSVTPSDTLVTADGTITITAQLLDKYNNNALESGKIITWDKTGTGGSFNVMTTATDGTGKSTVLFRVSQTAGTVHTVTALDNTSFTGTSKSIVVKTASANKYVVTVSDTLVAAGGKISVVAQLADKFGNHVKTRGLTIIWSKTGTGGSFLNASTQTDTNGTAIDSFVVSQTAGISHTITATDDNHLTGTSKTIITKPGPENKYIVTSDSYNPVAGQQINIAAQLTDQYGNNISTNGKTVAWSSTNGGTFEKASSTTTNGKATVKFTTSLTVGVIHKIKATDNTHISGESGGITTMAISAPILINPANGSKNAPIQQNFSWHLVTNADGYDMQIATDSLFASLFGSYTSLTDTTKSVDTLANAVRYFWRVRAKKGAGNGEWSAVWNFTTVPTKPGKPVLISPINNAADQPLSPTLHWRKAKYGETYHVQVSQNKSFDKPEVDLYSLTDTTRLVPGLTNETVYYWRVNSTNYVGTGDYSDIGVFSTKDTIYAPSELVIAADTLIHANVSWKDNSSNESGFKIEKKDPGSNTFSEIGMVNSNVTNYIDTTVVQAKTYVYRVRAYNQYTYSPYSAEESAVIPIKSLAPPTDLLSEPNASGDIVLTWHINSNNEDGFDVYREELGINQSMEAGNKGKARIMSSSILIARLSKGTSTYIDTTVQLGKVYIYQINAYNQYGVSAPTPTKEPLMVLLAPTNLRTVSISTNEVTLQWDLHSSNETGYKILRANKPSMNYELIDSTINVTNTYTDKKVDDGKKYFYCVYAYNNNYGKSAQTSVDLVLIPLNPPTNVAATQLQNENKIKITWKDNSSSETGFEIERKESLESSFTKVGEVKENIITYTDESVTNNLTYTYRIRGINDETSSDYATTSGVVVGVKEETSLPVSYSLSQNYPNPFNPSTVIMWQLPIACYVTLSVYDLLGREVANLVNEYREAGYYRTEFSISKSQLSSGVYFYRIKAGNYVETKKMILTK